MSSLLFSILCFLVSQNSTKLDTEQNLYGAIWHWGYRIVEINNSIMLVEALKLGW